MRALHVGTAGAGLAGRMLAWRLLRLGCRVTLLDMRHHDALDTAPMGLKGHVRISAQSPGYLSSTLPTRFQAPRRVTGESNQ